ncbi:TonB-dependent receptor [Sphingomonas sp. AOB5]|uniref:TonB-dependent receptor n=1 Tax=Sphingomonas sp. AOB5 TaxID=3034017 RepID=UPI0023F87254|nr:TonB-dependent receptor [Sphingomonas sp. AOB5]MDF7776450.1 TonB-dependent receptor [Sphingomonas sp. AOB5]
MQKRALLMAGASLMLFAQAAQAQTAQDAPAADQQADDDAPIGEIVVTAQKRSERLQDVPIAVSAFSPETLEAAGVRETQDLRTQVPNLQFSRTAVNSTNISIRGIGSTLVNPSADPGVGVHQNNAPLGATRITDADFYDVERIEVLRGPQGTLYGRNATGGVMNTITKKPVDKFEASIAAEYGNYDSKKVIGMVNLPLGAGFGVRVAGIYFNRDGYALNTYTGNDADGRNLWAGRITLGYNSPTFNAYILYEHFDEDDDRMRGISTRCTPDPGPATVGGVTPNTIARGLLSQGCLNASIYGSAALGAPNSFGTVYGTIGLATGILSRDANANIRQSADPRHFASQIDPTYRAKNDLVQFNAAWDFTSDLQLNVMGSYGEDSFEARAEPASWVSTQNSFNVSTYAPGGVFNDPQLGATTAPLGLQTSTKDSRQWSVEARIQSSFSGPVNFNVGGLYYDFDSTQDFLYVTNAFNARSQLLNAGGTGIYIDPLREPDRTGHNYLISRIPYGLRSAAALGEIYWDITPNLKLTGGLRYTHDSKRQTDYPSLLFSPGRGFINPTYNTVEFKETTGKVNVSWKPAIEFTDSSLFYASYSKGYKGGGFNGSAGGIGTVPLSYEPEFVNAYELGTKNTLANGRVVFNMTLFYYNYEDYQIAKLVGVSTATENIDAEIKGMEVETIFEPFSRFRVNANLSVLNTRIKSGQSIDASNLTNGDPSLTVVKNGSGVNCVANTSGVATILSRINAGLIPTNALLGLCNGSFAASGVVVSAGVPTNLAGRELPNAPRLSLNLGAQYNFDIGSDWEGTLRADYYRQSKSFSQIYNTAGDRLNGYQNINMSLSFESRTHGLQVTAFVRNLTNEDSVATTIPTNQLFGLFNSLFLVDPRTYGMRVTKRF